MRTLIRIHFWELILATLPILVYYTSPEYMDISTIISIGGLFILAVRFKFLYIRESLLHSTKEIASNLSKLLEDLKTFKAEMTQLKKERDVENEESPPKN